MDNDETVFIKPVIYAQNKEYCYVDCADIAEGTVLKKPSSDETYTIGETEADIIGAVFLKSRYICADCNIVPLKLQIHRIQLFEPFVLIRRRTNHNLPVIIIDQLIGR